MDAVNEQALLAIARQALEAKLSDGSFAATIPAMDAPTTPFGGVFVSLHNGRRLRGCIGRLDADGYSLPALVSAMAAAVLEDPRFLTHPVTRTELGQILIEISILSPMMRTLEPQTMQPGVHGVYIRRGHQTGCFLPQVATHMKWDGQQMLSHCCCDKAGLAADAWRDPETEVYLFTAEILSERSR